MSTRTCVKCLKTKPGTDFSRIGGTRNGRLRTELRTVCKRCVSDRNNERRRASGGGIRQSKRDLDAQKKAFIYAEKAKPCVDCGVQYKPWVMQFDHRIPDDKCFPIGNAIHMGVSFERLVTEMSKCDLVCGNCHAERTHQQERARQEARIEASASAL